MDPEALWEGWFFDFDEAKKQALKSHKPILLQFHRDKCSGCKKLYATTYPDSDVREELFQWFVPLRLDILQSRAVRSALNAVWTPSFYFLDYKSRLLYSVAGYLNAEDFRIVLRLGLASYLIPRGQYRRAEDILEEGLELFPDNPRSPALLFHVGMVHYLSSWDNQKFRADMSLLRRRYPNSAEARMWPWMDE